MVSKNTLQFCNTGKDQVGRHILYWQFFANFSTMSRDNALICYTLKILCKLLFSNNKNYITTMIVSNLVRHTVLQGLCPDSIFTNLYVYHRSGL